MFALFLPLLAAAAPAAVPSSAPITVTGHSWAPFISPMGEPFRAHAVTDNTLANWFRLADRNHDGVLTADEMQADAERFFATLDSDNDGQIDPDELAQYEWEIAPDIQVMSKTRRAPGQAAPAVRRTDVDAGHGRERRQREREEFASLGLGGALQGAARYGLLNLPEPVAAADADFNRLVSLGEFKAAAIARFQLLDRARQGRITLAQLEALRPTPPVAGRRIKRDDKAADERIGNPLPPGE
jgi:Ca2+-binding EF-hand superfamily protein